MHGLLVLNLFIHYLFPMYKAIPIAPYLSLAGSRCEESPLRSLQPFLTQPGMISLGAGLPNPTLFPFKSISMQFNDDVSVALSSDELYSSMQYSQTGGMPKLTKTIIDLQKRTHKPQMPDDAWTVCITVGSQDGLSKVIQTLYGPDDTLLMENPTYSGTISICKPIGGKMLGLETDKFGLVPEALENTLKTWDGNNGKRPRLLYIVPTGQNPAGTSIPLERKKRIYEIACEYELIILEDDPYYFLDYGIDPVPTSDEDTSNWSRPAVPTFWSLDTVGRVIRFDSMSKILSSGIRIGFVTGPTAFVNHVNLLTSCSNLHTSGVSQMLAFKFLEHIGEEGWLKHVDKVSLFYGRRRDIFIGLCEKYLTGLCTWNAPTAGMFLWIKVNNVDDTKHLIENKARAHNVLLVPGRIFDPENKPSPFVRASFSLASHQDMETAIGRFATVLKEL